MVISARLTTSRGQRWLQNGRSAHILHRFDAVWNLVNDRNEVVSLTAAHVEPGPFTVVLDRDRLPALDASAPVLLDRRQIVVGPVTVDVRPAELWQPRLEWKRLQDLPAAVFRHRHRLPEDIEGSLRRLLRSVAAGDDARCRAAVQHMAGRGQGLTPAGDDVLVGVLHGLQVWRVRRKWIEMIVETAVPRTTTLSAAFLRAAAAGEATKAWHDLADGRAGAVERILAVGHTSGADAWAGICETAVVLGDRAAS